MERAEVLLTYSGRYADGSLAQHLPLISAMDEAFIRTVFYPPDPLRGMKVAAPGRALIFKS